jgi:hypothetical protein
VEARERWNEITSKGERGGTDCIFLTEVLTFRASVILVVSSPMLFELKLR